MANITLIGATDWRNQRTLFGIRRPDRRPHAWILGKSGRGKTTLLQNLITQDLTAGHGLAVIDPHGDMATSLLDYVPRARTNDVIYFNGADLGYPVGLNPFEQVTPDMRFLVAEALASTFRYIWREFWGPQTEHILRHKQCSIRIVPEVPLTQSPVCPSFCSSCLYSPHSSGSLMPMVPAPMSG
jgi:hypothetical protein